jgi:cyclic beta-1,2-glucan synthetase
VLATALQGDSDRGFELFQMINPLTRSASAEDVQVYKAEPYVVAADVYTAEGQLGRGGWTWYTGSASWFYRIGLESILGFVKQGNRLFIKPRVPASWPGFDIDYTFGRTTYHIRAQRSMTPSASLLVDGIAIESESIVLVDNGKSHDVYVEYNS